MAKRKVDPRAYSSVVFDGVKQTPSRAMLRAVGFDDRDFRRTQIGIASTWSTLTPCNMHIDELAEAAASGVAGARRQADHLQHDHGVRRHLDGHARHALFAGVARGDRRFDRDRGRRAGLRRLRGHRRLRQEHARLHDGDRAAEPAGGVRLRRHDPARAPERRDIVSVFEAVGAHARGHDLRRQLREVERTAIPGPGSCGGMYTANTMASAIEALGLSLPTARRRKPCRAHKRLDAERAGEAVVRAGEARHPAVRHPHARGVRERHRRDHCARAVPPMRCCTCSRSRTRPACSSSSTTSRASASGCRCWPTCGRAASTRCRS